LLLLQYTVGRGHKSWAHVQRIGGGGGQAGVAGGRGGSHHTSCLSSIHKGFSKYHIKKLLPLGPIFTLKIFFQTTANYDEKIKNGESKNLRESIPFC
jgi:hypothetical protein